jgi:hypothetical protein
VRDTTADESYDGGGGAIALAAGTALSPRWLVFAALFSHGAKHPRHQVGGNDHGTADDLKLDYGGLGIGATYFGPGDVQVSATLAAARVKFDSAIAGASVDGRPGPALVLELGRDWWVSDHLTLGPVLRLVVGAAARTPDSPTRNLDVGALSLGVALSYD